MHSRKLHISNGIETKDRVLDQRHDEQAPVYIEVMLSPGIRLIMTGSKQVQEIIQIVICAHYITPFQPR
jgi:hypothetical protein